MNIFTLILIKLIKGYKFLISPLLGHSCRYLPTCSEYTVQSIQKHGIIKGLELSIKRISKCHPWGSHGYDPVPKKIKEK